LLEQSEIFLVVISIGIFLCVILPLLLFNRKIDNSFERIILCVPSGELVKISGNSWNKLVNMGLIRYHKKYNSYIMDDKFSKYKLKNRKII